MAQAEKRNGANGSKPSHRKLEARRKRKLSLYKCEQCDFRGSKSAMSRHSVVHTGDKPYPCTFPGCSYRAGWTSVLQQHLVTHASERDKLPLYHCDHCEYVVAKKSLLRQHQLVHENAKPFACNHPSCNFRTKNKYLLARHKKLKHEKEFENMKIYSCDQCDYSSKLKWNLASHVKTHSKASVACEFTGCNFTCRLAWNLKVHIRRHHDPSESYFLYCNVDGCAFKTTYKPAWKKHLETHNPNREPLVCTLCSGRFYAPEALERHVALCHTGEEWYSCKLCKFSSKYNTSLKKHMKEAHASEQERDKYRAKIRRKYKCCVCNYASVQKSKVFEHERIHTGEKPLACSSCSFRTSDSGTLVKHTKRIHGRPGEQTFECSICKVKFAKIRTMMRHMKTVHFVSAKMFFHCEFCNYSSKHENQLGLHIITEHGSESDADEHKSDSSSLELYEGKARKKKYSCTTGSCTYPIPSVRNRRSRDPLHSRYQTGNKLGFRNKQKPAGRMVFKCNHCSYSSLLAETINTHLRKHVSKEQIAADIMMTRDNDKEIDPMVAIESGQEHASFDSKEVHKRPKIYRVFACGFCDLLSTTYAASLVHSVEHRTLIISLERVVVS